MSWYSDGDRFNEWDPSYCRYCERETTKEQCDRCQRLHEEMEVEEDDE